MRFRPCIDIHNGSVKQIVGSSLKDEGNQAKENFTAENDAAFFADMYRKSGLKGGHIIILNPPDSEFYKADLAQAREALRAYPKGLQAGGGINATNGPNFIDMGASHVIVTSFVFKNGEICYENLRAMKEAVGKEHLVLDLSCRYKDDGYYIVTDRWQKFTNVRINDETLDMLSEYCDEYLIHAVDVEGKASGIEEQLAGILGEWAHIPITYAGGVSSFEDLKQLRLLGKDRIDVTIGSALDIFGGSLKYSEVLEFIKSMEEMYEKI